MIQHEWDMDSEDEEPHSGIGDDGYLKRGMSWDK